MSVTTNTKSWKAEVRDGGKWISNGLRFATEQEAKDWGYNLLLRWLGVQDHRATPSSDAPNYIYTNRKLEVILDLGPNDSEDPSDREPARD